VGANSIRDRDERFVPKAVHRSESASEKVPLRVARMIAREVAERRLTPGTMLDTEQDMAQRYGVGRASVREALRLLEAQGLIVMRRGVGGGPAVGEPGPMDLASTITMFLQVRSTSLREVIDATIELEGIVAALAADRVANEKISVEPLREALEREGAHLYEEERLDAAYDFHGILNDMANNEVLGLLVNAVGGIVADRTRTYRQDVWDHDERRRMYGDHVKLLKAIERGDSRRAALVAKEHFAAQAERDLEVHPEIANAIVDWR
jgi:DNA-binding FadR family transcriptional regulator